MRGGSSRSNLFQVDISGVDKRSIGLTGRTSQSDGFRANSEREAFTEVDPVKISIDVPKGTAELKEVYHGVGPQNIENENT